MKPPKSTGAFTLKLDRIHRRIITPVKVVRPIRPPKFESFSEAIEEEEVFLTKALWDTGASRCSINRKVVEKLQLPITGFTNVIGHSGLRETETYLVEFILPNGHHIDHGGGPFEVALADIDTEDFDVIIGMEVIKSGDFAITNYQGQTWFTFRQPSQGRIDFEADSM